jgi:hypothetical protein
VFERAAELGSEAGRLANLAFPRAMLSLLDRSPTLESR